MPASKTASREVDAVSPNYTGENPHNHPYPRGVFQHPTEVEPDGSLRVEVAWPTVPGGVTSPYASNLAKHGYRYVRDLTEEELQTGTYNGQLRPSPRKTEQKTNDNSGE